MPRKNVPRPRVSPRSGPRSSSRLPPDERKQSGLRVSTRIDWEIVAEDASTSKLYGHLLGNGQARLDEFSNKPRVLVSRCGYVPPVDQGIHEQLRSVVRAGIVAKRQVAGSFHCTWCSAQQAGRSAGGRVRGGRILTGKIA